MENLKLRLLFLISIMAAGPMALAQTATTTTTVTTTTTTTTIKYEAGVVKKEEGLPVTVSFSDGREATLVRADYISPKNIKFDVDVFESLCNPSQTVRCQGELGISATHLTLIWTKHSNPSRVNTLVLKKDSPTVSALDSVDFIFGESLDNPVSGLDAQSLTCPDFSWLTPGQNEAPEKLMVVTTWQERASQNPETGANENQQDQGAREITLLKSAPQTLIAKSFLKSELPYSILFSGDVAAFMVSQAAGKVCQVAFKPTTANLAGFVNELTAESKKIPLEQMKPAIYQSTDPIFTKGRLLSFILGSLSTYTVEGAQ